MLFDCGVVMEQMRACGLLETARIRSLGYPVYMGPEEFLVR